MEAYAYHLPAWPSPEQSILVTVDIFQQDIYRIFESASSNQVTQESVGKAFHRTRVVKVVPNNFIRSVAWEDEIAALLTNLGLGPENNSYQAVQELPHFVREMARAALERGFNGLLVVCIVEFVHKFVPMTGAHDGVADFDHYPSTSIDAYSYGLTTRPSPEQSIHVTIDFFRQDIYRVFRSEPSVEGTEMVAEALRLARVVTVEPHNLTGPEVTWEDTIATLLTSLNLEPENRDRAMQELPRTISEMVREALQGGFSGLFLVCTVPQVYMVEEPGERERWFLAAMADGKVRSVHCLSRDGSCPICLDGFLDGSEMYELSCSHAYHPDCIRAWFYQCRRLGRHVECPLCRHLL